MAVSTFETMETKSILTIYDVHLLQSEDVNLKLRGCDWIFSVDKESNEGGDGINVHLERVFSSDDSLYGCIATVSIELKSYDANVPSHIDHIAPREYSTGNKKWSLKPFISWDQLINPAKRFIDDNKILLEVKVKADKPRKIGENSTIDFNMLDPSGVELKLGIKFNEILNATASLSPEFFMFGMPMRLQVYKNNKFDDEQNSSLCVFMWNWRDIIDGGASYNRNFQSKFKLLVYGQKDNTWSSADDPLTYELSTGSKEIGKNIPLIGFEHFIPWQQLKKAHMSPKGEIRLEIEIKEIKPNDTKKRSQDDCKPSGSDCNGMAKKSNIVKCSSCFEDMFCQTLLRVQCGHLYCCNCIDVDLKQRHECIVCGEPIDVDNVPPQIILFD